MRGEGARCVRPPSLSAFQPNQDQAGWGRPTCPKRKWILAHLQFHLSPLDPQLLGKSPTGAATRLPDPPEGTVGRKRKPPGLKPACGERGVPISPTLLGSAQGLGGIGPLQMPLVSHKSLPPALGAVSRPQGTGQTGWNPVGQPVEARKARSPSERPGAAPKGTRRNRVALSLGKGASRARPRGAPRSGLCFTQAACPGGLSVAERDRETETERLGDREAGRQSELGAVTVRL